MSPMYEAIRKDNGQKIAGTLVELNGRSFILPDVLGSIGASYDCTTETEGCFVCTLIGGFVEVLTDTVSDWTPTVEDLKSGQITFEGDFKGQKAVSDYTKKKKAWEDGFQKWSNEQSQKGEEAYGACGYGSMCDYCKDNSYGRPCVRALNAMIRDKWINLDYDKLTYEDAWCGNFKKE